MRIPRSLAAISVCAIAFFSCNDSPTGSSTPGTGGGGYYVKCTINGVAKTLSDSVSVQVQQANASSPVTLYITGFKGSFTSATYAMASIFVPGSALQTYNPGGPITWTEIPPGSVYSSINWQDSLVHSQVTLTRCDPPGGVIEGTFKGTVYDSLGDSLPVTNGSFRARRPTGSDSGGLTLGTLDTITLVYDGKIYTWKSKKSDGTPVDLVRCIESGAGAPATTTISGAKMPGIYEMVSITMLGPANGSYKLGYEDQGALMFALAPTLIASTAIDSCSDDNNKQHPINAPVDISSTVQAGRARGSFSGTVVAAGASDCPRTTKSITGSFSIAVTSQ